MPVIKDIRVSHHKLPLDPPFVAAWDGRARHEFLATIVRIEDDEGRMGVGSGDLMLGFGGHEELFIGRDPQDVARHYEVLSNIDFHYGRCWPLDLAIWDLCGKIEGKPVWRLLGGEENELLTYASCGVHRDDKAMAAVAERLRNEGFKALKVRFKSTSEDAKAWRDDIRTVEAIRARIGNDMEIMVDCNQGWRMPWDTNPPRKYSEALAIARELERLEVYWMEEPLHRSDIDGMRRLKEASSVRIAGGEMTREPAILNQIIEKRALDVVQPDAALVGGITGLCELAKAVHAAGLIFTPHTWTNGLGVLANAHLTAGVGGAPFLEWPYDPPEWSVERRDFMFETPLSVRSGLLQLSEKPGFGIELDEDLLSQTKADP